MVSKTLKKKVPAKQAKRVFEVPVVDSAKDIFFAGLGVFSVAQQEGEKLIGQGTRLFDKLVSEGARIEKKSLNFAENTVNEIKTDVEKRLEGVRQQANENWDQLGNMFDERVPAALERLGIPTSRDLDRRIKDMSAKATNNLKGLEKVARDASNNLSKLEKEFTKRVKVALESLQVPSIDALNKLSESVKKASRESADNLGKLETMIEKRVASVFGKLETSTAKEFKKLNADMADVSRQVTDNFGKLESVVEKRVRVILDGLGIPSPDDFNKLTTELNKLSMKVSELDKQLKDKAKAVAAKPATGMTVAERKKAAEAISMMKPANKPETAGG